MMVIERQNEIKEMEIKLSSMLSLLEEYKRTLKRKENVKAFDYAIFTSHIYEFERKFLEVLLKYTSVIENGVLTDSGESNINFDSIDSDIAMRDMKENLKQLNDSYPDNETEV